MLKIFYNPDNLELIFSISVALLNTEGEYLNGTYDLFPKKAMDLCKGEKEATDKIINDVCEILGEDCFDEIVSSGKDYYMLFGIYPKNEEENKEIFEFFDKKEKEILLWIDWHEWPEGLLNFLKSQSDKIHIVKNMTPVQILEKIGYVLFDEALEAEKAVIEINMNNQLASRYIKTSLSARSLGFNNNRMDSFSYFSFVAPVSELVTNSQSDVVNQLVDSFDEMAADSVCLEENFREDIPEFEGAKKVGKTVGCLILDDVAENFFIERILAQGIKKYPWLCVVIFTYNGTKMINCASEKIPISEILNYHTPNVKTIEELLSILNSEVVRCPE